MLDLITACAMSALTTADMPAFTRIESSGAIDIDITVDPNAARPFQVRIEGDEESIARVEAKVEGGTLIVRTKSSGGRSWTTRSSTKLTTTVRTLEGVDVTGSGDRVAKGLDGAPLDIRSSGSGDARIEGRVGDLNAHLAGSGDLRVEGIEGSRVKLSLSGSGDIELTGRTDRFEVDLMGSGDIDAGSLVAEAVRARVMGSGDIKVCARGDVDQMVMGSGTIETKCR